jgi:hypothetical protein
MSTSCNVKECYKCNNNIASWMPFSPYHMNKEEIGEEVYKRHVKYYLELLEELKKISRAYRINYEDLIVTENFPYALSLDIKEQIEYYYSLFEEDMDDYSGEE